jgi:hypothetical protein
MGIRGELFSTRVTCEGRTYFFNVKENRMGDLFLTIVESKPTEAENFDRRSVVVFRDDMGKFIHAFQGALDFMSTGKTESKPDAPRYTGTAAKPRAKKMPAGFAGASNDPSAPAPKRKLVVRRKATPDDAVKD